MHSQAQLHGLREAAAAVVSLLRNHRDELPKASTLHAIISDCLPHWPEIHYPLRDLLSRPLVRQLALSDHVSAGVGLAMRESLISDLSGVYAPAITSALGVFIDSSFGRDCPSTEVSVKDSDAPMPSQGVFQDGDRENGKTCTDHTAAKKEDNMKVSRHSWWLDHLERLQSRGAKNYGP